MTPTPRTVSEITDLLLARDPLPPLVPVQLFDAALPPQIEALNVSDLVKIGLHVLNDDLEAGHRLAQVHEGTMLADYWHAVIHRREGDYDNSRYWFRRVGSGTLLAEVYGPDPNAPFDFVERCRAAGRTPESALEQFQQDELAQLLAHAQSQSS